MTYTGPQIPDPPIQPTPWPEDQCAYCRGPVVGGPYSCTPCWEKLHAAAKAVADRIRSRSEPCP